MLCEGVNSGKVAWPSAECSFLASAAQRVLPPYELAPPPQIGKAGLLDKPLYEVIVGQMI